MWGNKGSVTIVAHVDNGDGGVACCRCFLGCEKGLGEGGCREALEGAYCGHLRSSFVRYTEKVW